jgi:hypothetical protein
VIGRVRPLLGHPQISSIAQTRSTNVKVVEWAVNQPVRRR